MVMRAGLGNAGWVAIDGIGAPGLLYVRVRDEGGRLRICEIYLDASDGPSVDARDVRELPLRQVETLINQNADHLRGRFDVPGPDLSTLASYFAAMPWKWPKRAAEGDWVTASLLSQRLPEGERQGSIEGVPVRRVPRLDSPQDDVRTIDREFQLDAGPADGLTDEFLHDVARAYDAALARGERPNVAIAEQTGYGLKTAQRWVYTARQRGIMPRAGRKGAAG